MPPLSRLMLPVAAAAVQLGRAAGLANLHGVGPRVPDLADPPIAGTAVQYLDSSLAVSWTASNGPSTVNATVPGDLLTDLQMAGVIGDPLYELNWVPEGTPTAPIWDASRWNYTATFDAAPALMSMAKEAWLVFDGIKMAADIFLNGRSLGYTADQFLRYSFPVGSNGILRAKGNVLTVSFTTSVDVRNSEARWSACSGGWDWAPYTNTACPTGPDDTPARTFSKGIWKDVYLVSSSAAAGGATIAYTVPLVFYNGSYPTAPLSDGANGPWTVQTRVTFQSAAAVSGSVTVTGSWSPSASASMPVTVPAGTSTITVTLSAANVSLWWPNGLGAQALYNVSVSFTPSGSSVPLLFDSRRIGFRTFALVTADDSNPAALAGQDGSGSLTMRYRVNGANIWARGANMIPVDQLEGRLDPVAIRTLVASAAAAHFNVFRFWGGGMFAPAAFYDACDEAGLLLYHDMQYAQGGHSPANTSTQEAELRHQMRRLAPHPSLAMVDFCNECGATSGTPYVTFVAPVVVSEDPSRPPWPSCPSNGWASGVDMLWGLPNGSPLGLLPRDTPPALPQGVRDPRIVTMALRGCKSSLSDSASASFSTVSDVNCTAQYNADYNAGTIGQNVPAASAAECCAKCAAAGSSACFAAVYYTGTCWFKPAGAAISYSPGRVAVWPAGHGPIPPLPPAPPASNTLETHGPYQHGGVWPAVNGDDSPAAYYNASIPPTLGATQELSPYLPGIFASEFGGVGMSSFESMAPTLDPQHWGLHGGAPADSCGPGWEKVCTGGNVMSQRNYPVDNIVTAFFAGSASTGLDLNATGEAAFQRQLYMSLVGQALQLKSDIEARRSGNEPGTIVWQFGEIWPTGGWGSVEYATAGFTAGQVRGGRWKALHHFYEQYLYRDVFVGCGGDGRCIVKNDNALAGLGATVTLTAVAFADGSRRALGSAQVSLPVGAGVGAWLCINGASIDNSCPSMGAALASVGCSITTCAIEAAVVDNASGAVVAENFLLAEIPGNLQLPAATLDVSVGSPAPDGSVPVTVTSSATALYVQLTSQAQGRFSSNAFPMMGASSVVVNYLPFYATDADVLAQTLRVEHLAQYL